MAAARSWSIWALVAPVFACTVLICWSKSAAILTAATPNAATASPAAVMPLAISADLRPVFSMPEATVFAVLPARVIAASYEAVSAINRMTMFLFSAKESSKNQVKCATKAFAAGLSLPLASVHRFMACCMCAVAQQTLVSACNVSSPFGSWQIERGKPHMGHNDRSYSANERIQLRSVSSHSTSSPLRGRQPMKRL